MKIFTRIFLAVILLNISTVPLNAQSNGEDLFKKTCAVCHQFGNRFVGPDLIGVTERREEEWLIRYIKSSQSVIKSGDEYAVKLFNEYNKLVMPDQPNFTDDDVKAILAYIESQSVPKEPIADSKEKVDDLASMPENFFKEEVKEGKRLFLGLKSPEKGGESCVSCHNIITSDTLNWNPSAFDLSKYSLKRTDAELLKAINNPGSGKLAEVHKTYELSQEELTSIKAYLINIGEIGMKESRPLPKKLLEFILFSLLIVLVMIDLIWTKIVKYKTLHTLAIIVAILFIGKLLTDEAYAMAYQIGYAPDQPIKFSHKIHADQNKIDCQYCHTSAEKSKTAGIPSADLCMNCHKVVKSGSNSGFFEIAKIYNALENNEPIEWLKIHNLPDHVYFNHSQHVNAGKINCNQCHGKIEEMHIAEQVEELSMGWCLECHRNTKVQFENNEYYKIFEQLHEDIKSGKVDSVTVADIGGTECQRCHY